MEVPINYLAVLLAAVANMVLGFVWFGPLFGTIWMKYSGRTAESIEAAKQKGMTGSYVLMVLTSLLMAYVLAHTLVFASSYTQTYGVPAGLMAAIWSWLGFVVPTSIGVVLWDGKSWMHWIITYSYYLVGLIVMGIILAVW